MQGQIGRDWRVVFPINIKRQVTKRVREREERSRMAFIDL
jgi:hypothetical protein